MQFNHYSVLKAEAIEALNIRPNGNYVDATMGGGGHSEEILKLNSPKGLLIGIDRDPDAIFFAQKELSRYQDRLVTVTDNYSNIKKIIHDTGISKIDGVLLDLGVSSYQLSDEKRGFSFKGNAPLDMRMGSGGDITAADILNTYSQDQLQDIFSKYGEERFSKTIATKIVASRQKEKFETTNQLTELVEAVYTGKPRPKKIHPATKVYQALRIEVNQELEGLQKFLDDSIDLISPGGRLVIISFHSLEDKIVKDFFKLHAPKVKFNKYAASREGAPKGKLKIITKKPITPSKEEIEKNPPSRSAKMRIAEIARA